MGERERDGTYTELRKTILRLSLNNFFQFTLNKFEWTMKCAIKWIKILKEKTNKQALDCYLHIHFVFNFIFHWHFNISFYCLLPIFPLLLVLVQLFIWQNYKCNNLTTLSHCLCVFACSYIQLNRSNNN